MLRETNSNVAATNKRLRFMKLVWAPAYCFGRAWANRHSVYQEIKSGRPRFRIISLLKRWSQNESGFRLSR